MKKKKTEDEWKKFTEENSSLNFYTFDQVRERGRKNPVDFRKPKKEDIYLINFTSGSTGNPKGVIITHEMVMTTVASVYQMKEFKAKGKKDPRFIVISIFSKSSIGFYSGHIPSLLDDIKTLSPTIVVFVPRVLSRIYQKALEKVSESRVKRAIFHGSINAKTKLSKIGLSVLANLIQRLLFSKLNNMLGGRVRIIITGSAPCPPKISKFIRAALKATFHVGYGASETCGPVTVTYTSDKDDGSVGVPICCSSILLKDVPDMDIIVARDNRGEICIKGPNCTAGYYMNSDQTKELIDDEGWLHTGDVGCWDKKGRLVIVDRCKNLFKLSQGEYISPEKLENAYQLSPFIEQIFIDGDSTKCSIIALVVPNPDELKKALILKFGENEFTVEDITKMYNSRKIIDFINEEMTRIATNHQFNKLEQTKLIKLLKDPFTLESGMLTPTLKFVRSKIRGHYAKEINDLYVGV